MAIVVPVISLFAAGTLVAIGRGKNKTVPSTIATAQIARVSSDSAVIEIESTIATYSQDPLEYTAKWPSNVTATFHEQSTSGAVQRLLWTDDGASRWMFVRQPPGVVRHTISQTTLPLSEQWYVEGTFDQDGFQAKLIGLDSDRCSDLVVVSRAAPSLGLQRLGNDQGFAGGSDSLLPSGQFIGTALMSDVQRRRQDLVRQMTATDSGTQKMPTLLLWTEPFGVGAEFGKQFVQRGAALVSLPIRYTRTETVSDFQVPASFVQLQPRQVSTVYNQQNRSLVG